MTYEIRKRHVLQKINEITFHLVYDTQELQSKAIDAKDGDPETRVLNRITEFIKKEWQL